MNGLLLNSDISDDFSLGASEKYIPEDIELKNRIIRFKTPSIREIDPIEMEDFFKNYDTLAGVQGKSTKAAAEFYLEKFFKGVQERKCFDEVRYIEDNPGNFQERTNFLYEFFDNGRSIRVYDKMSPRKTITEISRLVEIKRGNKKHVILCDPTANRNPKTKFKNKIGPVKEMLEGGYTFSCMLVYASDMFKKYLLPYNQHVYDPAYPSYIEKYLSFNDTNMILVYSTATPHLKIIGENVLNRIKDNY